MDIEQRLEAWWSQLDAEQREAALAVRADVPAWMVESLDDTGIVLIDADLTGRSRVKLMPSRLRAFLDEHNHA